MTDRYAAAGVDITAGNEAVARYREIAQRSRDPRILDGIGGFGGCFEFRGYRDPVLVASTDGVGTKVLIAAALHRYDTVGQDLVNHCVNDILCVNAQPLFFLDYYAVGKLDPDVAARVVGGVAKACAENGAALLGGETAEMPGVYAEAHFDIAGTIVGAAERDALADPSTVSAGDAIIALPANGLHTNGYSLARSVLTPERWVERLAGSDRTIGDALLAVHPSYLRYVRAVQAAGVTVKAMAHITGGGLIENLPRILPGHLAARFDRSAWSLPAIVAMIAEAAELSMEDAHRTLNMGVGFCMVVAAADKAAALAAARAALKDHPVMDAAGATASVVGEIEPRHACGPAVIIA
ncbi:MAG TPA: phosphoribosylformylglycinamidine cyclo-ligase [Candidatus Eremiobacteraceae bacterium]|nr:phosphoribosylformylglycinamidine cyclo-ligase [Candidatus Eremiobacteraceae bacterium]